MTRPAQGWTPGASLPLSVRAWLALVERGRKARAP